MDKKLTDFTDTSDVSDEAIQWAVINSGMTYPASWARKYAATEGVFSAKLYIMVARLIQQHHPELLVDPDVLHVREAFAKHRESDGHHVTAQFWREGAYDKYESFLLALALYKEGKQHSSRG